MAWPFFETQFEIVRGIRLPDTCLPWLHTGPLCGCADDSEDDSPVPRDTLGDGVGHAKSPCRVTAFRMHRDFEEFPNAGTSPKQCLLFVVRLVFDI